MVTPDGNIQTVAGNGHPSQPGPIGDGGSAVQATLNNPGGMAVDAAGNLYIADSTNSVVRVVNMQATPITVATVTVQPGAIATIAGQADVGGCEPSTAVCGDGGPALLAQMDYPIAVSVDPSGNIYISDYYDNRVRCVVAAPGGCPNANYPNPQVGWIVTYAGTGVANKQGNGGSADAASLHFPYGVAADSVGDLQIADSVNNEIRCVAGIPGGCASSKTQQAFIYDFAFTGKGGFSGDGGSAKNATMQTPQGIGYDPAGNLYVGGGVDLVVRRIDAQSQTIITVAGNPNKPTNLGFAGDGNLSIGATLDNLGLSVNAAEQLLIADQGNNRIRQVDMVPVPALWNKKLSFPNTTVGQTSAPLQVKFQNAGLASLQLNDTVLGGADPQDFQITSNSCTGLMQPESFCYVSATFTPTQAGQRTATLTINTALGPQLVNLLGTGQ